MKNAKKIKILPIVYTIILGIAIISLTTFSFAMFNTSSLDKGIVETGNVNIEIVSEKYSGLLDDDGTTDAKIFSVKSTGSKSTYARVKITPSLEYYNPSSGGWETCGFANSSNIRYNISAPSWSESQGYYYNKNIMNNGDVSKDFSIDNISVDQAILENNSSSSFRVVFSITAEGCQASNDNYKLTWGSDCVLPDDIETFKDSDIKISWFSP